MLSGVLVATLLATSATPTPSRPGISRAEADSFLRKLDKVAAAAVPGRKAPAPIPLTESEVNSYMNLVLLPTLPTTVRDFAVRLGKERVEVSGLVDIDEVKEHLELSPWNPLSFLGGEVKVTASGRYLGDKAGFGRVEIESVHAGRVPIPISVIEQLVARTTRTDGHPEGVDIRAPFRLPHPVRRMRLEPGRAVLDL